MSLTKEAIEVLIVEKLKEQAHKFNELLDKQEKAYKKQFEEQDKIFKKVFDDQEKKIKKAFDHLKDVQKKLEVIEGDLVELSKELEVTQRLAYSTDQYQRRNNLEISGIPHDCDDNLEEVCISLVNSIVADKPGYTRDEDIIGKLDIEGCHRLRTKNRDGTKNTIIRFVNRKVCEDIMQNKKSVKNVVLEDLGDEVKNIYFNENLNKYYNGLSAKCRRLKKKRKISDSWTLNGIVRIKLKDNSIKVITHQHDLDNLFPNFVYFE